MILLEYIIWSPDPVIFKIPLSFLGLPDRPIVWYGLLFAMGFIIGQQISYKILYSHIFLTYEQLNYHSL